MRTLLFTVAALILIALLGVALSLGFQSESTDRSTRIEDLDALLRAYVENQGGMENIESIVSMRASGRIEYPGQREAVAMVIIKRRPHYYRATFELESGRMTEAYNGRVAWRKFEEAATGRIQTTLLSGPEREAIVANSHFDNLLVREFGNPDKLRYNGSRAFRGQDFYEIQVETGDLNQERYFLLNKDSLFDEFQLEHNIREGTTTVLGQDQFRKIGDVYIPFLFFSETDTRLNWRIEQERVQFNVGVITQFFDPPAEN